jgi:adenosine deaminase
MTKELWKVYQHCDLDASDLREIALNGFRYAFLPHQQKQSLLQSITDAFPLERTPKTPLW